MSTDQRHNSGPNKKKTGLDKHFEQFEPKPEL